MSSSYASESLLMPVPPAPLSAPPAQAEDDTDVFSAWLGAHTVALHSVDAADDHAADLAAFGQSIGNARIVMLGSQTHGEGNVQALKTRLVKYLHEAHGFNVLLVGSGLYDGLKLHAALQQGQAAAKAAEGALFYVYTRSRQMAALFDYVDATQTTAQPLTMAAMDIPQDGVHSRTALLVELHQFVQQHCAPDMPGGDFWADWAAFAQVAQSLIQMQPPELASVGETSAFASTCRKLVAALSDLPVDAGSPISLRPDFWLQMVSNLRAAAAELCEALPRDSAMAENVLWLAESIFSGQRIIIWTHSMRCVPTREGSMAELLRPVYGQDLYTAWFTGGGGAALDYERNVAYPVRPATAASWEGHWQRLGFKQAFLDIRNLARQPDDHRIMRNQRSIRTLQYRDGLHVGADLVGKTAAVPARVDGVFYVDEIQPVRLD